MKITSEMSLKNFKAWSGAKDTLNKLIELNKGLMQNMLV